MPTLTSAPTQAPAQLRRLPTPRCEPPYDDVPQRHRTAPSRPGWVQGSLALAMPTPAPAPPLPPPTRRRTPLRLVPDPPDDRYPHLVFREDEDEVEYPIPAVHRPWVARLAQALLEALAGERPHGQLLPWTSDPVYSAVAKHAIDGARRRPNVDLTRHAPPLVKTVRVSKPTPGVAEVCALVQRGPRTQAVALRLEAWRGRWRCTAFELA